MPTHGAPASRRCRDQLDDAVAVARIERGGRLVEQQDRVVDDQRAGDVDALLLAAGEGGRRQRPQALRDVEQGEQELGALARLGAVGADAQQAARPRRRRWRRAGSTRRNWLTKPMVRRRTSSTVRGSASTSSIQVAVVMDADRARVGAVVAVERAQQRALAGADGPTRASTRPARRRRRTSRSTGSARPPWACAAVNGILSEARRRSARARARVRHGGVHAPAGSRRRASGCRRAADRPAPGRSGHSRRRAPPCITISRWASRRATPRSCVTSTADRCEVGRPGRAAGRGGAPAPRRRGRRSARP